MEDVLRASRVAEGLLPGSAPVDVWIVCATVVVRGDAGRRLEPAGSLEAHTRRHGVAVRSDDEVAHSREHCPVGDALPHVTGRPVHQDHQAAGTAAELAECFVLSVWRLNGGFWPFDSEVVGGVWLVAIGKITSPQAWEMEGDFSSARLRHSHKGVVASILECVEFDGRDWRNCNGFAVCRHVHIK